MGFSIHGLGTAVPSRSVTQERAAELTSLWSGHDPAETRRRAALYRRTGIRERHLVVLEPEALDAARESARGPSTRWRMRRFEQEIGPLALQAAQQAIVASGLEPGSITHLVTVSCTGFSAPGLDLSLIPSLGLPPGVERTHIGFMGCHGALNGLRVARAFAESDPSSRVLLCAAELCSLHFRYDVESDRSVANALFADGAAAIVGAHQTSPATDSTAWRVVGSGSCLLPDSADAMSWRIGDHGFVMTLSPRVAGLIAAELRPWLEGWLERFGLSLDAIGSWAVHPGGPRIIDAVEEAIGLDQSATEDSREVLASFGNMSSPTVLFILDRLRRRNAPRPCVALAFGPGLVIEAALLA